MEQILYELPEGWEWKNLTDVTRIGAERGFVPEVNDGKAPFVGMSNIDQDTGLDSEYELRDFESVRKGYTKFQKNAVLLAKITPCTENNKTALIQDINGGYATTEVYPIHSLSETYPHYLLQFLRSPSIRELLVSKMEGATGRQRVPTDAVSSLKIPLPPLNEQKRIVAKLDALFTRIDIATTHLQQTLKLSKALFASALDEVFDTDDYSGVSLEEVVKLVSGQHLKKGEYTDVKIPGSIPYLTGPAEFGDISPEPSRWTSVRRSIAISGDTLITVKGSGVGKVNMMFDSEIAISRQLMAARSKGQLDKSYLHLFFQARQQVFADKKTGAAIPGIGRRDVLEQVIPIPSLDEQHRIVVHLEALSEHTRTLEAATQEKLNDLTTLKASLLDAAFKGQLMQPLNESA